MGKDGQELTTGGGVGAGASQVPAGQGEAAQPTAGTQAATAGGPVEGQVPAGQQVQGPEPQQAQKPVNLDDMPEFRQWKSKMDRQVATARQQAEEAERRAQALQQRADEALLASASPEERAEYYRQQAERMQQQQQQAAQKAAQEREVTDFVLTELQKLGVDPNTPGLVWPEDKTWATAAEVIASAGRLAKLQSQGVLVQQQQEAEAAAREAGQQALKQTGVNRVVAAEGGPSVGLRDEYEKRRAALKRSGDVKAALDLKREFRERGLDV